MKLKQKSREHRRNLRGDQRRFGRAPRAHNQEFADNEDLSVVHAMTGIARDRRTSVVVCDEYCERVAQFVETALDQWRLAEAVLEATVLADYSARELPVDPEKKSPSRMPGMSGCW